MNIRGLLALPGLLLLACPSTAAELWSCSYKESGDGIGTVILKPLGDDQYQEDTSIKYPSERNAYKSSATYKLYSESDAHLTLIQEYPGSTFVLRIDKKAGTFELDGIPGDAIPTRGSCVPL